MVPQPADRPPRTGVALTALRPGEVASIVHLEDEPPALFSIIAASGLRPGQVVRVLDRDDHRISLATEAGVIELPPLAAANIHVGPSELPESASGAIRLSSLAPGVMAEGWW